jgi:transposase-like protein
MLSGLYVGEGMTIAALAARFEVAPQTVHNWLIAAGVPRRPSPATVRRDISSDEIVRLYVDGGLSAAEVAEQLGCSASLVYVRLARRGVPRRDRGARRRRRPADSELAHLYGEGGLSLRELARRYGVSAQAVQRWLIAGGIERRPPGAPRVRGVEDPVALYVAGWSAPVIAERLGCSPSTIYRRLDAAGVARQTVEPSISRHELIKALETGMAAPAIAARAGVSVSCVCRALDHEQLMTRTQATRQAHRRRHPELYADRTDSPNGSVSGNAQH